MDKTTYMKDVSNIELNNPVHLKLESDGYGQFPDSYKLTEKGIEFIKEIQIEAYNQALDDAVENADVVWSYTYRVDRESILKLKK